MICCTGCVCVVLDSIVVSISACHAEAPGSIPGRGALFFNSYLYFLLHEVLSFTSGLGSILVVPLSFANQVLLINVYSVFLLLLQVFIAGCPSLLQLMSALKSGEVANVRMASIIQQKQRESAPIPVDRSGGGL